MSKQTCPILLLVQGILWPKQFRSANIHDGGGSQAIHAGCWKSPLMYGRYIRSWRMLCHSRYSLQPLSLWKGFTLELLKVSCVGAHTAAVQSAGSSVGGRKWLLDIGSSRALGLLQRSLAVTVLFVSRRNRRIYRGYAFQPSCPRLITWEMFTFCFSQFRLASCYVKSINGWR